MEREILEFLKKNNQMAYSIGSISERFNLNLITTQKHLQRLTEKGEIKKKQVEILLLNGSGTRLTKINIYWYDGEDNNGSNG